MIAQAPRTAAHDSMPLVNYFHDVYCKLRTDEFSRATCEVYRAAFSRLGKHLGRLPTIGDLTSETVSAFMQWLVNRGRSPATANSYRNSLLAMWRFAREQGHVDEWPDMSIIREYRSYSVEEHRSAMLVVKVCEPPTTPRPVKAKSRAAPRVPLPLGTTFGEEMAIRDLVGHFLNWQEGRVAENRMQGTRFYLRDFEDHFGQLTIAQFRPGACARVDAWIKSHKGWNGCRASVVSRVKQLFAWGATGPRNSQGFYVTSPVASLERPKDYKRVSYFTAEQVTAILAHGSENFRTAFRALLATGCRPNELGKLTADDVERDDDGELYWRVHHKNEHHTGDKRRIYLTDEAQQITREQLEAFPNGRLFRSSARGRPAAELSETYLNHALRRITENPECKSLGLDEFRESQRSDGTPVRLYKYVAYTARHTFAVRYLTGFYKDSEGTPIILGYAEIAQYLGNSAAMVEKIYGHLVEQKKFLSARLRGVPLNQIGGAP